MIHSLPHKRIHISIPLILLGLFAVSCGSYQSASYYDNDGIYSSRTEENGRVQVIEQPNRQQAKAQQNNYGDYFGQKADEYGEILESEVFTDIDGYYGNSEGDSLNVNTDIDAYGANNDYRGYAAWGDNPTNVNINIYDNWGYGGFNYYWGSPWFYSGYYGHYYPWRWGFYGYPGYGYYNWGWGGYGYVYGWGHHYRPYYYNHYYRPGYNYYNRNYAYNASRRGIYRSNPTLNSNALRGRSNLNSNNSTTRYRSNATGSNINRGSSSDAGRYRTSSSTRSKVGVDALNRNSSYRTSRSTRAVPNYNSSTGNRQTYKGTTPSNSTYRSNRSTRTPSTSTYRSSSNNVRSSGSSTRSSSGTIRSASSPSRSSGSVRSSSSSTRSSSGSRRGN